MPKIKFENQVRPAPIRLGSGTKAGSEYVRSPYPTESLAQASPSSLPTPIVDKRKIYHLTQKALPSELEENIYSYLCAYWPPEGLFVTCSSSLLTVTRDWELVAPHLRQDADATNFVRAHHIHVQFLYDNVGKWRSIARDIRAYILFKHDIRDVAVGFGFYDGDGNISAWYPPKVDKAKLKEFFEDDESRGTCWDENVEDTEEQGDSLTVLHTEGETNIIRTEVAPPSLRTQGSSIVLCS
ncbi:hypothetical protein O1611_g6168 [Lasiodiplodia mahajangana]|uniref:Uncharacterized protein n=1 Tax=Lasiodiplodia mahajangana TaxID=1108764 RepID=A0ACC2JJK3_9PEZI|nr:hypothetical protein O1611_g6168 [Lasiodiplodia mahajangana]